MKVAGDKSKRIPDKINISDIPWTSPLPKPDIKQHIWKDSTEQLMRYIDWHGRHPGCVTPREFTKRYEDGTPVLADHQIIDDDDPTKFYYPYETVIKTLAPPLTEEFKPTQLGRHGDVASVAELSNKFQSEQFDISKRYYEDPWYVASVRDQLNSGFHADGYRTPSGNLSCPITYKDIELKTMARKHIVIRATPVDFQTATTENKEKFAKFSIQTSGSNVKSEELQRKAMNKQSPWGSPQIWSIHTKHGKALDKWKKKVMEDDVTSGINEFEASMKRLKKDKKATKKKLFDLPLPPLLSSLWKSSKTHEKHLEDTKITESEEIIDSTENVNDNSTIVSELTLQDFDDNDNNLSQLNDYTKGVIVLPPLSSTSSPSTPSKVDLILSSDSPSKKLSPPLLDPLDSLIGTETPKIGTPSIENNDSAMINSSITQDIDEDEDDESINRKKGISDVDLLNKFNDQMGGADKVDKLADQWVNFAVDIRKKSKKSNSNFFVSMDIADSCDRGNYARAFGMLSLGANSNAELDEVTIFNHVFQKCVNLDVLYDELTVDSSNVGDRDRFQKILDLLVMFNANVNSINKTNGLGPIHIAAQAGDAKILKWLLKNRGDPDLYDKQGMTALMLAAMNGHIYAMAELLRSDAQINKREKDFYEPGNIKKIVSKGRTALHFAAAAGQTQACIFLIRCQADKKLIDYDGVSPAYAASENGNEATAQQILTFSRPTVTVESQLETMVSLKKEAEDAVNSLSGQLSETSTSMFGTATSMFGSLIAGRKRDNESNEVIPFNDNMTN